MSNEKFIENLNKYNELLKSNYKSPKWTVFANAVIYLLFCLFLIKATFFLKSPAIAFLSLILFSIVTVYGIVKKCDTNLPSFLDSKFDLKCIFKNKILKDNFTGEIGDIFDLNCKITKQIIAKNHGWIENALLKNKSLSGNEVLFLFTKIREKKKEDLINEQNQLEKNRREEEKSALIKADTKVGQSLNQINKIVSEYSGELKNEQ